MDEQTITSLLGNSGFNPGMMRGFMGRRPGLSNMAANNPMVRKQIPNITEIIQQNPQALSLLGSVGGGGGGGGGGVNLPPGLPTMPPGMPPGFRPPPMMMRPQPVRPPISRGRV